MKEIEQDPQQSQSISHTYKESSDLDSHLKCPEHGYISSDSYHDCEKYSVSSKILKARAKESKIDYKGISENLLFYVTIICSFAIVEGMIGISHTNVHLVRDFLNSFLMMGALCFSSKALELSLKPSDEDYSFGYRRYNILAAFVNIVEINLILFMLNKRFKIK